MESDPGILPELPNDLALRCLVRVPRQFHGTLMTVCRRWTEALRSREFYALRKDLSLSEPWVYVLSRDFSEILHWHALDPKERKWKQLPPMPGDFAKHYGMTSAVLDQQLFVLGGGKKYQNPTAEVLKFDPVTNKWREAGDMETARCYFTCAAFDDRLYAVGGMSTTGILTSWEIYDPALDRWTSFQDPNIVEDLEECLVFDGKLYIRHVRAGTYQDIFPPAYAAMYDLEKKSWVPVDNEMTREWRGPATVSSTGDKIYMLDKGDGLRIMALDKKYERWTVVGRLAPISFQRPGKISVVGRTLYMVGQGLRTITVELDNVVVGDLGLLVVTGFEGPTKSSDNLTLSCHVLEL